MRSIPFAELLKQAQRQLPPTEHVDQHDLREKRNEIIHYGFSPKDDEISAILLLETGFRLIEQYYEHYFDFHLKRHTGEFGGLLPDVDWHLDIAQKVYSKAKELDNINLTYCFRSFAHDIRWVINHWMLSDWQMDALGKEEESGWSSWEFKDKQKTNLESQFGASWTLDCPICEGADTFVVELEDHALGEGEIRLTRGACVDCSFVIPADCPFLADELCMDEIVEATPKILKEYGVA